MPPQAFTVVKADGGERVVAMFSIPDEAVSRLVYKSLMRKNRSVLSAHAYAYRNDVGVFDAMRHILSEWRGAPRLFVAEYDFADYFGSLSHDFISDCLGSLHLYMSGAERHILEAFLSWQNPHNGRGIPQGTSLSLFLANVALTPLDRKWERLGVGFARYGDDSLLWARGYEEIGAGVEALHAWAVESGVPINERKTQGIRLLVRPGSGRAEFRSTEAVDFLGHRLSLAGATISEKALDAWKQRASRIIYDNLLREPLRGAQNLARVSSRTDRDYVVAIWQLRRLIYGHLSENDVQRLLQGGAIPHMRLTGLVAQYPTISGLEELREFDRWLLLQLYLAPRKRARLLGTLTAHRPEPWQVPMAPLRSLVTKSGRTGATVDLRAPSAVDMRRLVGRAVRSCGPKVTSAPLDKLYSSSALGI